IIKNLRGDACHAWRAETGIELIHKEPDRNEQLRIWANWNRMTERMKTVSDNKCRELFAMTNTEHIALILGEAPKG
ncbi:MAG: hypothetical protein LBO81_05530, partial [Clostridiales Family XIII bacterium]|nr:hypothetical protein [Clostridiales Family XIII bacterium]